jgi:DNA repair exonuclease SbcCD ATPase subunit
MQTLNERLEQLKDQLKYWEAQSPRNQSKIDAIQTEIDKTESELKQAQQIELSTASMKDRANVEVANILDNLTVEIGGERFSMRELCTGDAEYGILNVEVQMAFVRYLNPYFDRISGLEEELLQSQRQNRELQEKNEEIARFAKTETDRADDAETKRDAAVREKEEALEQVEKIRSHMASGAPAPSMESLEQQRQKYIEQIESAYIKVQSIEPIDFKRSQFTVVHLDGTTETVSYLRTKSMKIATGDEVQQFRLEQAQKAAADAVIPLVIPGPELPIVVTEQQFPGVSSEMEQSTADTEDRDGESGDTGSSEYDAEVLRAELEALEKRVKKLEQRFERPVSDTDAGQVA